MRNFPFFSEQLQKTAKIFEILLETLPVDEHYVTKKIRLNKYKVVISVCLSVLLVCLFVRKIDQVRVNGGSNYQ